MNVATLVERFRSEIIDDEVIGGREDLCLWSNTNIINYLNDTIDELSEETLVISDQSTAAIAEVKLLSNTTLHAIDDRILQVRYGRLETGKTSVIKTTEDWLEGNIADWRNTEGSAPTHFAPSAMKGYLSIYPKYDDTYEFEGDSDISFVSATKTISQTGGDFSGLEAGDEINVDGTTNNDGYFTVATVGTDSFTVSESLTNESNTSATIKKVEDTLLLSTNRIQLTPFTVADIAAETSITELKAIHHPKLLNGMGKRAFLKPDSDTYDKGKSREHERLFEIDKKRMKRDIILLHKPEKSRTIRSGQGIGY